MVDGRLKRIPQPWLWVLAGAALVGVFVFVFAVAPSLLIGPPPKGLIAADELKARNDVRTTLVQALAGLAVAGGLVVTYRTYRQNRAEQDRTYQLNQTEQQRAYERELRAREEQDRTYERELYAKAVEQLGHEKAPVRLGALYSLERLAQDKPDRHQVIVDVICAYLRMPFSPSAPRELDGKVARDPAEPTETEAWINEIGNTWRQERQVRITAQRILAEHLRDDETKAQRLTDPPSPRFWPNIRLDLAGATLIDFNLDNGAMAEANLNGATFSGDAGFAGATFNGHATFDKATFNGHATFDKATFGGHTWFAGATFGGTARFAGATFSGHAWFSGATFNGDARFDKAIFGGRAWFDKVTFSEAGFGGATFSYAAFFDGAKFDGNAWFRGVTFGGTAGFGGATFRRRAWFDKVTFSEAGFTGATFSSAARFDGATFNGDDSLSFDQSRVLSLDDEHVWPTGWCLGPDGEGGYTVARANDAGHS
jgi:uncharacterized protein YjbI with pentapeptide repeats